MKLRVLLIALLLLAPLTPSISATPPKVGAICRKAGVTKIYNGKKFTCVKSGKKLVWNKGVAIKETLPIVSPTPNPTPSQTPTSTPTSTPVPTIAAAPTPSTSFAPWSVDINSKTLSDQAQRNFIKWAQSKTTSTRNHTQIIQPNANLFRISLLKKVDEKFSTLFNENLPQNTLTVIGFDEGWTVEQLRKYGWQTNKCNEQYGTGLALCLNLAGQQGYVITTETNYDPSHPGGDGAALLAHEFFHIVQSRLLKSTSGFPTKDGQSAGANGIPAWFLEGTAGFVGFSVASFALDSSYWEGRARMLSYAPPVESTNRNSIWDYEIRTCCGNDTPTYPYVIGQVATEYIVASIGFQAILDIWTDYEKTKNFERSFERITGISKEIFYEKFDEMRTKVGLPAITWKLDGLINKRITG